MNIYQPNGFFIEDYDGAYIINYYSGLFVEQNECSKPIDLHVIKKRINEYDDIIADNITKVTNEPKALSKWVWFQNIYEHQKGKFIKMLQDGGAILPM